MSANDSTSNSNNISVGTAATATTGVSDGGAFVAANAPTGLTASSSTSNSINGSLTLESWLNIGTFPTNGTQYLISKQNQNNPTAGSYSLYVTGNAGSPKAWVGSSLGGTLTTASALTSSTTAGSWHLYTGTYDGTAWKIYIDGVLDGSTTSANGPNITTEPVYFGASSNNGTIYHNINDQSIDEARISNVARSADWINTEYRNIGSPSTFMTTGTTELYVDTTPPSVPTTLSGTVPGATPTTINLSWSASTDNVSVTGYEIFRGLTSGSLSLVATAAGTTFSDTGLSPMTDYYYAVAAEDAAGNLSGNSTVIKVTTGLALDTTPPSIPSSVSASSTTATGTTLTWSASTDPTITNSVTSGLKEYDVYRDGNKIGSATNTTYTDINLSPSTSYTYSLTAVDNAGNVSGHTADITTMTQAPGWYSAAWMNRKLVTIDHAKVSAVNHTDLANFPLLVSLNDVDLKSMINGGKVASNNGYDLVFTDSDGTTALAYEIEKYDPTAGILLVWVKIPFLSANSDKGIFLYSNNQTVTTSKQNAVAVWDSNYAGVYHLGNSTNFSTNDSTSNANNGSTVGTLTLTAGVVGGSGTLPTNGRVNVPSSSSLNGTGNITVEAWMNPTNLPLLYSKQYIITKQQPYTSTNSSYDLYFTGPTTTTTTICVGSVLSGAQTRVCALTNIGGAEVNSWHQYTGTYDGTAWRIYQDGVLLATTVSANGPHSTTEALSIGATTNNGTLYSNSYISSIDEARVSNAARSADWINTEYTNMANPSASVSLAATETYSGVPAIISFSANPTSVHGGSPSTLSWAVSGADTLSIDPVGSVTASALGTTTVNPTVNTTYTLSATNTHGTSQATATILIDVMAPSVPTGVATTAVGTTQVALGWSPSTDDLSGVAGYNIYRGTSADALSLIGTSTTSTFTDTGASTGGLSDNTTYYYSVAAYDFANNLSAQSSVLSVTTVAASGTVVNVSSNVALARAKRFGMNLGTKSSYGGGQMFKSLIIKNPGFEPQLYRYIIKCASTANNDQCTDNQKYDTFPNNFWSGAKYEVLTGNAKGRAGTVTDSSTGYPYTVTGFDFSSGTPAIGVGDYIVLTKTVNDIAIPATANSPAGTEVEGWWLDSSGAGKGSFAVNTSDLPPGTDGTQTLKVLTSGGLTRRLTAYVDAAVSPTPSHTFRAMNGHYQISFKAKKVGGGASSINVVAGRVMTYLNQNVPLSNSWQTYTLDLYPNENASTPNVTAYVNFNFSDMDVLMDDVSLMQIGGDPTNTTVFSDGVVSALRQLRPGIIRNWDSQLASGTDDMIAPWFGKKTIHWGAGSVSPQSTNIGLEDLLALCQLVGAEPWEVIPDGLSPQEIDNLMEYLGGDVTTPYGAIRAAHGHPTPWTQVFPEIHLELGNENWNNASFAGGNIPDSAQYGQRGDVVFARMKASPYYDASKYQFILGDQTANTGTTKLINQNSTHHDAMAGNGYFANVITSALASNYETLFGELFGDIEQESGKSGELSANIGVVASSSHQAETVIYEQNMSTNLIAKPGIMTQAQANGFTTSLGAGLALADGSLMHARDLGIRDQNTFNLSQYAFYNGSYYLWLFGTTVDMGATNRKRPAFLAQQLADEAIGTGTDMLQTTQTGDNPTWTQTLMDYGVPTTTPTTSHYIQAYAYSNGNLVLFNLNRYHPLTVKLSGTTLPSGQLTISQLTSGSLSDNNENSALVGITRHPVSNFDPSQPITLPPGSMTTYVHQIPDTTPPTDPSGLAATPAASSVTLSWTASTDDVQLAGYKIYRGSTPETLSEITTTTDISTGYTDSTVASTTAYYYAVAAYDTSGNVSDLSAPVSTTTLANTLPALTITSPQTSNPVNGTHSIAFTDTETTAPLCSLDNANWTACTSATTHFSDIVGWSTLAEGSFTLYLKDTDSSGHTGTTQVPLMKDTQAPVIQSASPISQSFPNTTTSTTLTVQTDTEAACRWSLTSDTAYDAMVNTFDTTGGTTSTTLVTGLRAGQAYAYSVRCADLAGNVTTAVTTLSFSVALTEITTPSVMALSPVNGATRVPIHPSFEMTFDQPVVAVRGKNVYVKKVADGSVVATIDVASNEVVVTNQVAEVDTSLLSILVPTVHAAGGSVVTITPSTVLPANVGLYISIDPGSFASLAGSGFTGIADSGVWSFVTGAGSISATNVSSFTEIVVRTDRMTASTPTGGLVCASTHTTGVEASVSVTFPNSFTVNQTPLNWTVTTGTNLLPGATSWPGIDTATAVSDDTVTFPSGDLAPDTIYCFNFTGINTLTTGIAGTSQVGSLTTGDATGTVNFSQYTLSILTNDQIGIIGVVPPTFSFDLDATTDSFTSALSPDTVTSTSGRTATIGTNANNGWVAWVKSANNGLTSASTGRSINTYGTINDTPTDLSTLTNTDAYNLNVHITTDSATLGTGTVSQGAGYGQEYAGTATQGGTLTTNFQPIASGNGVTDGDVLTLKEVARISALQQAATDYIDTLTVVAAGRF